MVSGTSWHAARWRSVFWTQRLRDWNNFKAPSPLAAVFGDWPPPENHSSPYRKIISTALWERTPTTFRFLQRAKKKPTLGRPTCMALPATLQAGSIVSLGCVGNRVYTGLGEDELYFVVRGKDLAALADALETITGANSALQRYDQSRRVELATV